MISCSHSLLITVQTFSQPFLYLLSLFRFTAPCYEENKYLAMSSESVASGTNILAGSDQSLVLQNSLSSVQPSSVLALAKKAMMASRKAALLAEKFSILESELREPSFLGYVSHCIVAFIFGLITSRFLKVWCKYTGDL